ncbi:MAG: hypothetical protein LBG83_07085 [Oscillospiraceae bacterium]|jgi:hypothetical protein|nr:hypothetical protein [Oscillospiraceae bacterium]
MKIHKISLRGAAALTVAMSVAALMALFTMHGRMPQAEIPAQPAPEPFQYVMQTGSGQNRLALYMVREGELVKVTEYDWTPEELPREDREILTRGLALRDANELQRALEDYLHA